ncbi:MAG: autotransporter outer membrane beta-barrel domain-containing protein, partial [Spongiibacteraceae bacterium]
MTSLGFSGQLQAQEGGDQDDSMVICPGDGTTPRSAGTPRSRRHHNSQISRQLSEICLHENCASGMSATNSSNIRGGGSSADSTSFGRLSVLVLEDYSKRKREGTDQNIGSSQSINTSAIAVDFRHTATSFFGLTASTEKEKNHFTGSRSRREVDSNSLGLHAATYGERFSADILLSYAGQDLNAIRDDNIYRFENKFSGRYWASDMSLAYNIQHEGRRLSPALNLHLKRGSTDAYREIAQGQCSRPRNFGKQDIVSTILALSLQYDETLLTSFGVLTLSIGLSYQRELSGIRAIDTQILNENNNEPINSFANKGDRIDKNVATLSVGLSAQLTHGWASYFNAERLFLHKRLSSY